MRSAVQLPVAAEPMQLAHAPQWLQVLVAAMVCASWHGARGCEGKGVPPSHPVVIIIIIVFWFSGWVVGLQLWAQRLQADIQ